MNDLRERVARAIARAEGYSDTGNGWGWETFAETADAAIAATKLEREVYVYSDGVMKTEMEPVPATSKGQPCCTMCETPLDIPSRPWTRSCGGDCLACMADVGDPDCVAAMAGIAAGVGAGWQELGDWRPKPWVCIDLWIQCYDLADRDSDRLVPTVGKRVPGVVWYDGQWCNGDGNPHEDLEGFEDARITHWRPVPGPPEFSTPPAAAEEG